MRVPISSGIGSLLSVMASHVRRSTRFGADAPHHCCLLSRAALDRQFSVGFLQDRASIGVQYSSMLGRAPRPPSPDGPRSWTSRVRTILSKSSPPFGCRPCLSAPPSSSRIPTGARPDSGEEGFFDWSNRVIGYQDPDYAASAEFDLAAGTPMAREALRHRPSPDPDGSAAGE